MYEPSRHISSFRVAGFQHYDGATVIESMRSASSPRAVIFSITLFQRAAENERL